MRIYDRKTVKDKTIHQKKMEEVPEYRSRYEEEDEINSWDYDSPEEYEQAVMRSIDPEMYDYLVERAQKRMKVSQPVDQCEREADVVAERIVNTNDADVKPYKSFLDGIYKRKDNSGRTIP